MSHVLPLQDFDALRQGLAANNQRPSFHFLSPSNWINDPHGLVEWKGQYHLFYQYNPHGPFHGTIHWGHAVSQDLVHWRDLPIALEPGPEPYDQEGCWTGCMVINNGLPTIFFTATHPQTVAAAESHDDLITWEKLEGNPLIAGPPDEIRQYAGGHFRDPFIWQNNELWEMLVVSKIEGIGGQVLLYDSKDLRQWQYRGIFLGGNVKEEVPFWQGTMWECPNFLDFGDQQVLLISVQSNPSDHLYAVYFSGQRVENRFEPHTSGMLIHGGSFYAPQVMRLSDGRLLMFGWLHEERTLEACQEAGWNGSLSLPMVLDLLPDGSVSVNPAKELEVLRTNHWEQERIILSGETEFTLPHNGGRALEIITEFIPDSDTECGLKLFCSPDGEEQTRIVYKAETGQILVERDASSLDNRADNNSASMPVSISNGQPLQMRIFVDRSTIELFVNEHLCLACRVYPTRDDSIGVRLFSRKGKSTMSYLHLWQMEAVWPTGGEVE